ncbi:MAG: SDR family NAD(P)-dependent oxidoreductase [bacterium]|nr:SDR family NAD(P)-dependent oxidoreductase [bacterium]
MQIQPGQAALVTGASSGIGEALVVALLRRGVHAAAAARDEARLAALTDAAEALPHPRGQLLTLQVDVRQPEAVTAAVRQAFDTFGRLDLVIANAGVGQRGGLVEAPLDDLQAVIDTNVYGVLYTVRAAAPYLVQQGGHIVIVSSVVASMITPYTATYSASKAAVSSIARALRYELAPHNIGVTDALVGRTETAFNVNRLGAKGYADRAPRLPAMSPAFAAVSLLRAVEGNRGTVTLRPFDQLLVWVSQWFPQFVARRALRQYKTTTS